MRDNLFRLVSLNGGSKGFFSPLTSRSIDRGKHSLIDERRKAKQKAQKICTLPKALKKSTVYNTEVFGSNGSVGNSHFVRYSRKSITSDIFNGKFQLGN